MKSHSFLGLVCILSLSATVFAQEPIRWQIQPGEHQFASLVSIPLGSPGASRSALCGPNETTLILIESDKATYGYNCESYELPGLKKLGSFSLPMDWQWRKECLGSRYACSFKDNVLRTVDLVTGQMLKPVSLRTRHKPHLLFDKAVWFESGELLRVPQMDVVAGHSLSSTVLPFASNEWITINEFGERKHVWYPDTKHVVVNGILYDDSLRASPKYLGCFSYRQFNTRAPDQGYFRGVVSLTSTQSHMLLEHSKTVKLEATVEQAVPKTDCEFYPFRGGFVAAKNEVVHVLTSAPDRIASELAGDLKQCPIMLPPLITFDGKRHTIQWLSAPATAPIKFAPYLKLGYQFSDNRHEIWKTEEKSAFLEEKSVMASVCQRIRKLAGTPHTATYEQVVAAYKKRNLWWIASYAQTMGVKFMGLPVEIAYPIEYEANGQRYPMSMIFDFPESMLKEHWTEWPRLSEVQLAAAAPLVPAAPTAEGTDSPKPTTDSKTYLRDLATKEQSHELRLIELPPPAQEPLPALPEKLADPRDDFSWAEPAHWVALLMLPVSLVYYFGVLVAVTKYFSQREPAFHFVEKSWRLPIFVTLACLFFSVGVSLLSDLLTAGMAKSSFINMSKSLILTSSVLGFSYWVFRAAIVGPTRTRLFHFGTVIFLNGFMNIVIAGVTFLTGGFDSLLKR